MGSTPTSGFFFLQVEFDPRRPCFIFLRCRTARTGGWHGACDRCIKATLYFLLVPLALEGGRLLRKRSETAMLDFRTEDSIPDSCFLLRAALNLILARWGTMGGARDICGYSAVLTSSALLLHEHTVRLYRKHHPCSAPRMNRASCPLHSPVPLDPIR